MKTNPVKILFNTWANSDNINAQSLTAREIAIRLNPEKFISTFFLGWKKECDQRLSDKPNIKIVKTPPRLGSLTIFHELLFGRHDIIFYPMLNTRAFMLYWHLKKFGRKKIIINNFECSFDQFMDANKDNPEKINLYTKCGDINFGITPDIRQSFKKAFNMDIGMIPLGVDLSCFKPVERNDRKYPVRVLYVASIQPRKQTHLILEFANKMKNEPVEFHIIGPVIGGYKYMENLLEQKKITHLDNVHFHGPMLQKDIVSWMQKSDIYILPSRLEGFGKTTIEAAATGLPSIIFDDYKSTTVADNVTGFQVKTEKEMLERLRLLVNDQNLRIKMGKAAAEYVNQFSWDKIAKKWEKVFLHAVSIK